MPSSILKSINMVQIIILATLSVTLSAASKLDWHHFLRKKLYETAPPHLPDPYNVSFKIMGNTSFPLCSNSLIVENGSFLILRDASLFVPSRRKIYGPSSYQLMEGKVLLCMDKNESFSFRSDSAVLDTRLHCETWTYEPGQYQILENGSVLIGDDVYSGRLKFFGETLHTCFDDHGEEYNATIEKSLIGSKNSSQEEKDSMALVYVGNIGCGFSVVALACYLLAFALKEELRNPPGYNLTSLSISLLLGYLFFLIGQLPQVLGTFCVICAILSQYLFLASFFWMNCISFDVWRTLWYAIRKLQVSSRRSRVKKFLVYSLYSWGVPVVFILAAVIVDYHPDTPRHMRPAFGMNGFCIFNGMEAKKIFFAAPGGTLFIINTMFFCHSTYLVLGNSMKHDDNKQTAAKRNFLLYVRLGVIMGITWLVGIVATFNHEEGTLMVFNLLNSTQGVFVFLLFFCSRKTCQQIRGKVNRKSVLSYFKNTNSEICNNSSSEKPKESEMHETGGL